MSAKSKLGIFLMAVLCISVLFGGVVWGRTVVHYIEPGTSEVEKARVERLAREISEVFPDIEMQVEYIGWPDLNDRLITMIMAGNVPDFVLQQDFLPLARMGMFEVLDSWIDENPMHGVTRDIFVDSLLEYSMMDGNLYTIPALGVPYGLNVREDWLNEAGFTLDDLETWDGFLEVAAQLTKDTSGDGRIDQWGFVYPTGLSRFGWRHAEIMAHSNNFYLDEIGENPEKGSELLDFLLDLKEVMPPGYMTMGLQEAFQAYSLDQVGMMVAGAFMPANIITLSGGPEALIHTRAVPFPKGPSAEEFRVPVNNSGYAMFAGSRNKEAAWQVMTYLSSKENNLDYSAQIALPTRKDIAAGEHGEAAAFYYEDYGDEVVEANARFLADYMDIMAKYGIPRHKLLAGERLEREFTGIINDYMAERIDADTALQMISERFDEIMEEYQ